MRRLLLLPALAFLAGCPNTDAAVFVEPTVTEPALTVKGGTLGVGLEGSFTLSLHLGPRASGPSQVSLGSFTLTDASQKETIVDSLAVATTTQLPVTVDLDSDVDVPFTIDTGSDLLPAEVKDKLCDPAGVVISGTIEDSLQNRPTPLASAVIHPSCP